LIKNNKYLTLWLKNSLYVLCLITKWNIFYFRHLIRKNILYWIFLPKNKIYLTLYQVFWYKYLIQRYLSVYLSKRIHIISFLLWSCFLFQYSVIDQSSMKLNNIFKISSSIFFISHWFWASNIYAHLFLMFLCFRCFLNIFKFLFDWSYSYDNFLIK
jgi:hypothetical protein